MSSSMDAFSEWRPIEAAQSAPEIADEFSQWKPEEITSQNEPLIHNIGRQAARTASRAAETVLGAPRAFGEFLEGLVPEKGLKKIASKVGLEKPVSAAIDFTKEHAPYKLFPTQQNVRTISETLFGDSIKPQNPYERKADEVISDFAALAIPLPGKQLQILKPALLSIGGNLAAEGVGVFLDGTEKEKSFAKLGTILLGSLANPKGADKFKTDLYKMAKDARPAEVKVSATKLQKDLDSFREELMKGGSAPSKVKSLEKIGEIERKIAHERIDVEELEEFKKTLNEARGGLYEEYKGNKIGRALAKRNLDKTSAIIDDALNEYGKQNPEWETFYRAANEAHGAISQSQKVGRFLAKNYKKWGAPGALTLFGIEQALGLPASAAIAGSGFGLLKGGELTSRFLKSPVLRKHYTNVIKGALKDDAVVVKQNLRKIEEELTQNRSLRSEDQE